MSDNAATSSATAPTLDAEPDDDDLARWRDAAEAGDLPAANTHRWQPLRAGVVNLWEFDAAEYWFANGRAQFVGRNQSGKSTLMALTTLIMLAGDLDRAYVDTFGDQQKTFRYYVEATNEPQDRRETNLDSSRGWAWVEYGRLVDGQPRYFTTLLYAQARRASTDFTKHWAVCEGDARVRGGLTLATGSAVTDIRDLRDTVAGFRVARSGSEYKQWQASELFGFTDTERMNVVIRMLKVLRTPHLGEKLNLEFLTDRMRDALPAVDREEIDELAEGWDQLERLASDKEHAETALNAVQVFIRKAWVPWADAMIRREADAVATATTRFDDITRTHRQATADLEQATDAETETRSELDQAKASSSEAEIRWSEHLKSAAYQDAAAALNRVETLTTTAVQSQQIAGQRANDQARAEQVRTRRDTAHREALKKVTSTDQAVVAAAGALLDTLPGTGLSLEAPSWVEHRDTTRFTIACKDKSGHIAQVRSLLSAFAQASHAADITESRLATAAEDLNARAKTLADAHNAATSELQRLSDTLEGWATGLTEHTPEVALRGSWLEAVTTTAASDNPTATLTNLIRDSWLTPLKQQRASAAAVADDNARARTAHADALEQQAQAERDTPEPNPPTPTMWTRRERPATAETGAPMWRLLDPVDALAPGELDHLEAALAAAGLLDAWVSPDGTYLADRDGSDSVLTVLPARVELPTEQSLASVLTVANDAGDLAPAATALLHSIAWHHALPTDDNDTEAPAARGYAVAADGRWRTPLSEGRATPARDGAALLGTAARAAAQARRVALLLEQAATARSDADAAAEHASLLRSEITIIEDQFALAPTDHDVIDAARERNTAEREHTRAEAVHASAASAHAEKSRQRDDANASLITQAAAFHLPHTSHGLNDVATRLDNVRDSVRSLEGAVSADKFARKHADDTNAALADADQDLHIACTNATAAATQAEDDEIRLDAAREEMTAEVTAEFDRHTELEQAKTNASTRVGSLIEKVATLHESVIRAQSDLDHSKANADTARTERDAVVTAWWQLVDTNLPGQRDIAAPESRSQRSALDMARAARDSLHPPRWPADPNLTGKDRAVGVAWTSLVTTHLPELRAVLEGSGGRTVTAHTREETTDIERVSIRVDATSDAAEPLEATERLRAQVENLSQLHDEKINTVLVELLSSTFVEHLRDRLTNVIALLARVNTVLAEHPTGANGTTLRLRREAAEEQDDGYAVLEALAGNMLSDGVQDQVRTFLRQQILEAQDRGRAAATDWKDHLAQLLDYRTWFAVRTEYRVGTDTGARWHSLTREVHGKDSGGGKVVTLLQPLLATLVALYDECDTAPRPLWLDEAFTGVDTVNRATMLDLIVSFELDFLMAGPDPLIATVQVPSAAIWNVTRAPEPIPGVALSVMLWAGATRYPLTVPDTLPNASRGTSAHDQTGTLFDDLATDPAQHSAAGSSR